MSAHATEAPATPTIDRIALLGNPEASSNQPTLDSDSAIASLVRDIEQAKEHVHIGFYIWLDDGNGGKVADAVAAAARRGVHCRVMVDALARAILSEAHAGDSCSTPGLPRSQR